MRTLGRALLVLASSALTACGDSSDGRDTNAESAATPASGIVTVSDPGVLTETPTGGTGTGGTSDASTGTGGTTDASDPTAGPKFDLPPLPDAGTTMPDAGCQKVDVLFVIDNSGSMLDEQQNLVNSFPDFVAEMQAKLVDTESYHVGVITSDGNGFNTPGCNMHGALVTRTGGTGSSNQTCAPYASGKNYMDETDQLGPKFACAGQVGTEGDGNEQPMYALGQALTPAINGPGACNDGFIRADALLVVVVITDEEDDHEVEACAQDPQSGSPGEPADWFNAVVSAKAGLEQNVVVLALTGPVQPACPALNKCQGGIDGAEVAARVVAFTQMFTYGSVGQICAPSYKQFFSDAIGTIDSACDNFTPPG
jgi:hypothetical protein